MTTPKPSIIKPTPIAHGTEADHVNDIGGIPPYEISAWAEDKTLEEMYAELERRKDVARLSTGLLDHEYTTLEWLAAEKRQLVGRSAADIAAEATPEEKDAFSRAATPYYEAMGATKAAKEAHEAAVRARIAASQAFGSQSFGASVPESKQRELLDAEADAKDAVEDARTKEGEALVRFNATQSRNAAASQARRRDVQNGINRAAFLENVAAAGGIVDQADLDRHYPQPGRFTAALQRLTRRRR